MLLFLDVEDIIRQVQVVSVVSEIAFLVRTVIVHFEDLFTSLTRIWFYYFSIFLTLKY